MRHNFLIARFIFDPFRVPKTAVAPQCSQKLHCVVPDMRIWLRSERSPLFAGQIRQESPNRGNLIWGAIPVTRYQSFKIRSINSRTPEPCPDGVIQSASTFNSG